MVTLSLQKNVTKIEILEHSYDNKQREEKFEKFVVLVARWSKRCLSNYQKIHFTRPLRFLSLARCLRDSTARKSRTPRHS